MDNYNNFARRHIGLNQSDVDGLLAELGYKNIEDFSKAVLSEEEINLLKCWEQNGFSEF